MITVTSNYKNTIRGNARTFVASIETDTDEITHADQLVSVKIYQNADLGKAMIKRLDFVFNGDFDCLGKEVGVSIGLMVSGSPEYIDYGDFIVDSLDFNQETEQTTAIAYDKMYSAMKEHRPVSIEYPCTLYEYLEGICGREGWTLGTANFTNDGLELLEEPFIGLTVREVLQKIAEVSGTICLFDNDGELVFRGVDGASVETVNTSDLYKQKIKSKWGGLTSVAFDFPPYGDLIWTGGYEHPVRLLEDDDERTLEDGELRGIEQWVESDGFHQYLISESELASQEAADELFDYLDGYSFYPVELDTIGLSWIEVGDNVTVKDKNANEYLTTITGVEIELSESGYKVGLFTPMFELLRGGTAKTSPRSVINVRVADNNVGSVSVGKVESGSMNKEWVVTGGGNVRLSGGGDIIVSDGGNIELSGGSIIVTDTDEGSITITNQGIKVTDNTGLVRILIGSEE